MPQLIKDEAWKFVIKALEANIQYLSDQLNDEDSDLIDLPPEEFKLRTLLKQKQRAYLTDLLHLPENILAEAAPRPEAPSDDIY